MTRTARGPAIAARKRGRRVGVGALTGLFCALAVIGAEALPVTSAASPAGDAPPYVVTFQPHTSDGEQRVARDQAVDRGAVIRREFSRAVHGFAGSLPPAAVAALRANPDVRTVEPDVPMRATEGAQSPVAWNLDRIDQRALPLSNSYSYDADGTGVSAYVLDTGIRADHAQFGGRVGLGFTTINDGRGTNDCAGHGTHISGTIGGSSAGVAKAVTLVPVRVLDCQGNGFLSDVLAGLDWVVAHRVAGRSVVNLSLGGPASPTLDNAVNAVIAAGVPVVVAAGNEGADACGTSPARVPAAVTVGAAGADDARPGFSNFGRCVDLFAPGVEVVSTWLTSSTATEVLTGTSVSTPHVTGVIATLLHGAPGASPAAIRATLGSLLTQGALSNAGADSPNALLYAPPRLRLAGVGSATTDAFVRALAGDPNALALGGTRQVEALPTAGSSPVSTQDPATLPGCAISRPTSQAQGRSALLTSLGAGNGCLQFAQAEQLDLSPANPRLAYVPFARENVTFAISVVSALPKSLTLAGLRSIYRCEGNSLFRPMLPATGSGLREFWIAQMYPGGMPSPAPACLQDGADEFGSPIVPNSGGAVNNFEIVPMSVPQWTSRAAGVIGEDGRGPTRIGQIDGRNPFADDFGLQRDLYLVIPASAATGTSVTDLRLRTAFVGPAALTCVAVPGRLGRRFGFRPHPNCGSTSLQTSLN